MKTNVNYIKMNPDIEVVIDKLKLMRNNRMLTLERYDRAESMHKEQDINDFIRISRLPSSNNILYKSGELFLDSSDQKYLYDLVDITAIKGTRGKSTLKEEL